ncbi:hypothetical protein BJ170DRAFT_679677 [Xylariales sp. AK1849]|nr:hypothetical protein BJ170DRAFT_679677 [Xylariales sp. AK1849]
MSTAIPQPMSDYPPAPTPSFPAPPEPPRWNQPVSTPHVKSGIRSTRAGCEFSVREYLTLQKQWRYDDPLAETRLRAQRDVVLADLQILKRDVSALVKAGESHRWGRWVLGGVIASLIPFVRKIFQRPPDDKESSNGTEYAFKRSKTLVARVLDSVQGKGAFASVTLLVLSVLYVFQAEVSLRMAKTISKRLRKLTAKIERGEAVVEEKDIEIFSGWRWRVLTWKS